MRTIASFLVVISTLGLTATCCLAQKKDEGIGLWHDVKSDKEESKMKSGKQQKHDESVADFIDYFVNEMGVYYNNKQQIRKHENGMMGVFAVERIEAGEVLSMNPWNSTIHSVDECGVTTNLAKEMRLGNESRFAPYVNYLLNQRVGQLPSDWSEPAKKVLERIVGEVDEGEEDDGLEYLPPDRPTGMLRDYWHGDCDGVDDPFDNNAAMLVLQRAEDNLMLPVYDFYNHRNGHYLNTRMERIEWKSFSVIANETIEAGQQIYISYNLCEPTCGGRHDGFGTPEMFKHYGFTEMMPQRWYFESHGYFFDLEENVLDSESEGLKVEVIEEPEDEESKSYALNDFRQQIVRLQSLKKEEELKAATSGKEMSDYEWENVWRYCDALVNAMKHIIEYEIEAAALTCTNENEL